MAVDGEPAAAAVAPGRLAEGGRPEGGEQERRKGDRPPPATMPAPALDGVPAEPLDPRSAARLARKILAEI